MLFLLAACTFETGITSGTPDVGSAAEAGRSDTAPTVDTGWVPADTGEASDSAQPDETPATDTATADTGTPETDPPDTDTAVPDTGPPYLGPDPCAESPVIDCPVDVLDASACTVGVAAWLPTGRTYADVQSALDAATAGDTVAVCPGTWTGTLRVSTPDLVVRGYGAGTTTLDGAGRGTTLEVLASRLTVVDLRVTGGTTAGSGGGIRADKSDLRLCSVTVDGNEAGSGGGVYVGMGSLEVADSRFDGNTADYQGGAIDAGSALLSIVGGQFEANASGYAGGAVFGAVEGGMGVYTTTFVDNRTGYEGGAVAVNGSTSGAGACFVDTVFTGNEADYAGGAVSSNGWGAMTFGYETCTFDGNYAAFGGGAIAYQQWGTDTSVTVSTSFTGNVAGDHGGAIDLSGGWGILDAAFHDTIFDANAALLAGAIQAGGVGTERVLLVDSTVTANSASWAGALYIDGTTTVDVRNTDFGSGTSDNVPEDIYGAPPWGAGATFTCVGGVCR